MLPDPKLLAAALTQQTGLLFFGEAGRDQRSGNWIELTPEDHDQKETFAIKVVFEWRRLQVSFTPGKFAGPMLDLMASADSEGRAVFQSVMQDCLKLGGDVILEINGERRPVDDGAIWKAGWKTASLRLRSPNTTLDTAEQQFEAAVNWSTKLAAAIVALLPLIEKEPGDAEVEGYPEGGTVAVTVNRYERDPRNRLAAIAIHGHRCSACDLDFGEKYGNCAAGFIEIHHTTPVSKLRPGYVIDPGRDLVPLCSNCHSVAHRRNPPYSVEELRELLANSEPMAAVSSVDKL